MISFKFIKNPQVLLKALKGNNVIMMPSYYFSTFLLDSRFSKISDS